MIEVKPIEVDLYWLDVFNLINGVGGWKQRYELDLKYNASMNDDTQEWGSGGVIWRGLNFYVVLLSVGEKNSVIDIQMDNYKPVSVEAQRTWEILDTLFVSHKSKKEFVLFDSYQRHMENLLKAAKNTSAASLKPQKPEPNSNENAWFDYLHAMLDAGFKCDLEEIAKGMHLSYNYTRQLHSKYCHERGLPGLRKKPNKNLTNT